MAKYIELMSKYKMPAIGLGTWLAKPGEVESAVVAAVNAGYRLIDCAYIYGNEPEVGAGIKRVLAEGKVKRSDLFITSKLWNNRHRPIDVKPSLVESLNNLGVQYLDLFLIHWPIPFKAGTDLFPEDEQGNPLYEDVTHVETWKALEKCVDEGLIKNIGLSNFNSKQIQEVINKSRIKPAVVQIEISPYFQQEKLVNFCHQRGIAVTGYSSFGSPSRPWAGQHEVSILDDPKIAAIGKAHKKSSAQVILRWLMQRRVAVIPKSVTASRIIDNLKVFDFELTPEEMTVIKSLDRNARCIVPLVDRNGVMEPREKDSPQYPFHIEF